jgi:hypothetical protein
MCIFLIPWAHLGHKQLPYFRMRKTLKNFFAKLCGVVPRCGKKPAKLGKSNKSNERHEELGLGDEVVALAEVVEETPGQRDCWKK